MPDYIPRSDSHLRAWADNFAALIAATPYAYGLMPSDAEAISTFTDAFAAALTRAIDPSTRTMSAVADKDAKRAAMLAVVRRYAQVIKLNAGVSNEEKSALGLTLDAAARPIPAPLTCPVCSVTPGIPLQHTLRFGDSSTLTRRAKPPGAAALEIHYRIVPTAQRNSLPPDDPTRFYGLATRQPFAINLDPADVGKTAIYYTRWVTRTGLVGPWSAPVGVTVAA